MATPENALYKLRQREYEARVEYRGHYHPIPEKELAVVWDKDTKRHVTLNRVTRRRLGLY